MILRLTKNSKFICETAKSLRGYLKELIILNVMCIYYFVLFTVHWNYKLKAIRLK